MNNFLLFKTACRHNFHLFLAIPALMFLTYSESKAAYCTPTFGFSACAYGLNDFWITNVSLGTLNFTGGTCGGGLQAATGSVTAGSTYTLTCQRAGNSYKTYMTVYADWNHNNVFTDAGETLMSSFNAASGSLTYTASVTVPAGALTGTTRLRVISKYNAAGASCNAGGQGEYKDFNITVLANCTAPGTDATSFGFNTVTTASCNVTFTRGTGTGGVLVVAHDNAAVNSSPVSGTTYTASSTFGSGTQIGTGNYVVYNSNSPASGTVTVPVSNLTSGHTYYFSIYEYNTTGTCYSTTPLTGNVLVTTPCAGTPTAGTATAVTSSICPGSTSVINLTGYTTGVSGITFQWQQSATGLAGSFTNVSTGTGATTASYTTAAATNATGGNVTTYYNCLVGCQTSGLSASSSNTTVLVYPSPNINVNGSNTYATNMCSTGSPANISLAASNASSGTTTYAWLPTTGLSASNISNPVATPSTTTTYTVTATANTCTSTATAAITVNPGTVTFSPSAPSIGVGGSVSITASATSSNGTVSYAWLPNDGTLNTQNGATVSANPLSSETYTVTASDPSGCSRTGTVTVNVTSGTPGTVSCGYTFSTVSNTYTSVAATSLGATGSNNYTVDLSGLTTPFYFDFNGIKYNKFGVNGNGFIWFGSTAPAASTTTAISSALTVDGVISVWGTMSGSTVGYLVQGTTPNRTLTIQWGATALAATINSATGFSCQAILYEHGGTNSDLIQMSYANQSAELTNNSNSSQVGLRGASNADYLNRNQASGNLTTASTSAGGSNAAAISLNAATYINSNILWSFTPNITTPTITPTGQQNICVGGAGVTLTANTTVTSPTYQWINYATSTNIGGATSSTYLANPTPANNYFYAVKVTNTSGCSRTSSAEAVVAANCGPTVYAVTGGSNCGSTTVGVANSQTGATYQLVLNGSTNVGSPVNGTTGSAITFGAQTTAGTYTVVGTLGGTASMSGNAIVNANPSVFNITGGTNCAATTVGLSGSTSGVNYQLYNGASTVGSSVAGTGSALNFGSQTATGTYTVVATNATTSCASNMSGSAVVNANPTVYNVTGGINCAATTVGLSGSNSGINYQLYNGASTVGSSVAGTGSALNFGSQTATGTYTVVATNATTSCTSNMSGSAVVNANPTVYNVTGGINCAATTVGLSGSNSGVNYQLYNGASTVGSAVAGTGSALSFGSQTATGTYTVVATNATTSCTSNMSGSAVVNANPTVYNVTGGINCAATTVGLSGSNSGINYQLYNGASTVGSAVAGTGSALNFGSQTAAGTYTVVATNATTSCTSNMSGSAVVNANPTVYNVTGGINCAATTVGLSGSNSGINYQLYNGASTVGSAVAGTGSALNFGSQTATGTYTVVATNATTSCTSNMSGSAVVNATPSVFNITGGTNCGATTVGLSGSNSGINYQLYNGASTVGSSVAGTGSALNFGSQTAAGTYTVVATNATTSCTSNMSGSAVVNANPVVFNITGGTNCGATTVGLSGSNSGINYQLYNGASTVGSAVAGTGSALSFGSQTATGTYTVVATNATTSCTSNMSGSAVVNAVPTTPGLIVIANESCNGGSNGVIHVSPVSTGGTGTIMYSLNASAYQTSTSFSGLNAGNFTAVAQDANGCTTPASGSVAITQPAIVTGAVITATNITCNGAANGTVAVATLPTGGTSPYQYELNAGAFSANTNYGNLAPGNYTVNVHDAHGCPFTTNTVTVSQPNVLVATPTNDGPYYGTTQTVHLFSGVTGGTTAYNYSWTGPLSWSSAAANPAIPNAIVPMTGTYYLTVTDANGCTATGSSYVQVNSSITYTWTGATSTDWLDNTNWSPLPLVGVAGCWADVSIPSGTPHSPVVNSNVNIGNLQVAGGAILTLNANVSTCKDITGGNSCCGSYGLVTGPGYLILNGAVLEKVNALLKVNLLKLNNSAGVQAQANADLQISTSLDLQSGNFDAGSGNVTFVSPSSSQSAIVDNFSPGYAGTMSGNIKAQRYYGSTIGVTNSYSQHFMGSPVNAPSFSQFGAQGTPGYLVATPTCDESRIAVGSPYSTVLALDETHGATCTTNQWIAITSGNAQNGLGYGVAKQGAGILTLTGGANLNSTYTLTGLTNSGWATTSTLQHPNSVSSGWHLVSNPYLATLDISSNGAGFDNQVQVWHSEGPGAGSYSQLMAGSTAAVSPFQGFMIHKTGAGSSSYVFNASDRTRTPQRFYQANDNELKIIAVNTGNNLIDETTVAFNTAATDQFDPQYDADKPAGLLTRHTLYSENHGKWMGINTLHDIGQTSTVPVGFEPGATAAYNFSFNGVNTFDATSYIYLEDKALNEMHDARSGDYSFTADSADAWDRFVLHFTPAAAMSITDARCNTLGTINVSQPGAANWTYIITNSNNQSIASGTLNQASPVTVNAASGTYTLTLTDINNYTVTKILQVNGPDAITAAFTAPTTTVQEGQNVVLTSTTSNAVSYQWNLGNGQTATGATVNCNYATAGTYTVVLTVTNLSGCSSTTSQTITVSAAIATAVNTVVDKTPGIWSSENRIYVDFRQLQKVDAVISIYNVLGQEISTDKLNSNMLYQKEIGNVEVAYMIVSVKNEDRIITKKVFINNIK